MARHKQTNHVPLLIVAAILLGLCGGGVVALAAALWSQLSGPPVKSVATVPPTKIDLKQLVEEWRQNQVATVERYKGKTLRLSGFVGRLDTNFQQQAYLDLQYERGSDFETRDKHARVFFLDRTILPKMKDHPRGSAVTVDAVLADQPGDVPYLRAVDVVGGGRP